MRPLALLAALAAVARADPPPKPAPPSVQLNWRLLTAMLQNGHNNGYALTCGEAAASRILVRARAADGATATTTVDCPRAADNGWITLPVRGRAPFTFTATVPGVPAARSEQVRGAVAGDTITLRTYAGGCDLACDK